MKAELKTEDLVKMQILFLLGGFGTRLQKDIDADSSSSHLSNLSKALVPLGRRTILDYWITLFQEGGRKEKLLLQTNQHFYQQFIVWSKSSEISIGMELEIKSNGIYRVLTSRCL
jgi:hypothetical protein